MSRNRFFLPAAVLVAVCLSGPDPASAQDYVVMGTPLVNLRTGPSTESMIIGKARKGDIFEVVGETEGWYEIRVFSGAPRYVVKADFVYPLREADLVEGHEMYLPTSTARARSIFWDTESGLDRAAREASEVIPVYLNRERHTALKKILEDRILLEMFHIHGVQPALYDELVQEARREGWG